MGMHIQSVRTSKPDLYPNCQFDDYVYQEYPKMVYPRDAEGKVIGGIHATVNGIDVHQMPEGVPAPVTVASIEEEDAAVGKLAAAMEKLHADAPKTGRGKA